MANAGRFGKLFEPGKIGKLRIRNRIVMLPMGGYFPTATSEVGERSKAYFVERAKGGVGLIIIGLTGVVPLDEPITKQYFSLSEDRLLPTHYHLTEAVRVHGAKIGIQLCHWGSQMNLPEYGGKPPLSPSGILQVNVNRKAFDKPRSMRRDEVYQLIEYFARASFRAKRAGYDLVEIHAAHGYLLNSFLSQATNRRMDEFGGSLENRVRVVTEIVKEAHKLTGTDYPIGVRISAEEFIPDGITVEDSKIIAKLLEEAGAAYINIGIGTYASHMQMNDVMRTEEGWKLPIWDAIKKAVTIPTVAGGGNRHPDFCEKIISGKSADFIGLARQMLADPYWCQKAKEGREDEINYCISCLRCLFALGGGSQVVRHCTVNPMWGREVDYIHSLPPRSTRKVLVIGGGVAGMEAARVASMRGHNVTLYEKGKELGGQILVGSIPPGKEKLLWFRDYLVGQLKKQGVEIRLNSEARLEDVAKEKPEVVIVATGAKQWVPNIPGIKGPNVTWALEILVGRTKLEGKNIGIMGGGTVGCETAEYLVKQGNKVSIIEMLPDIAMDMEPINRRVLLDELEKCGVMVFLKKKITEIVQDGVVVIDIETGEKQSFIFDEIIVAVGLTPVQDLFNALEGKVEELYIAGDCNSPATILEAARDGFLLGYKV